MERFRDHSVDRMAVKALVAVYGPREAARQAGLPWGTMATWCRRYKWKKAAVMPRTNGINGGVPSKPAADMLIDALRSHKEASTLNLAKYVDNAARQAARSKNPLGDARAVRHVAQVYSTLYPPEDGGDMVEGAILIGAAMVRDNPQEMLANVREILPDQGPEGD